MSEIEKYNGPKPPMFPLQLNARIKNTFNLESGFGEHLADLLGDDGMPSKKGDKPSDTQSLLHSVKASKEGPNQKQMANIKAARQIAMFQKALDFMPRVKLAHIEQTGEKYNQENLKSDRYMDFRFGLNAAFWNAEKQFLKRKRERLDEKKAMANPFSVFFNEIGNPEGAYGDRPLGEGDYLVKDVYGHSKEELYGESFDGLMAGGGNTWSHNLNLYHGAASWNPFKKQDTKNFETFMNHAAYKLMNQSFNSPLKAVEAFDANLWDTINTNMQRLQDLPSVGSGGFRNPNVALEDDDFDLNWENAPDPYNDNDDETLIESFDVNANFYTMGMSEMWQGFQTDDVFSFIMAGYESKKRGISAYRDLLGKVVDLPNSRGADLEKEEEKVKKVVKASQNWWNNVGQDLYNKSMLLPFALMPNVVHSLSIMMDAWGDWGGSDAFESALPITHDAYGFKEKMIGGYLQYVESSYIRKNFQSTGIVTSSLISKRSNLSGDSILSRLKDEGFLDSSLRVTSKFKPNGSYSQFGSCFSDVDAGKVFNIMQQALGGLLDIGAYDNTRINGEHRTDLSLIMPTGEAKLLPSVLRDINSGDTSLEKYTNARDAYNTFFDMFESMTALNLQHEGSNGKVVGRQVPGGFEVDVYPNGQWKEWDLSKDIMEVDGETVPSPGWVEVKNKPVSIVFSSEKHAQEFLDRIRGLIALLEPVVGGFDPANNMGPGHASWTYEGGDARLCNLRVLVDNAGSIERTEFITPDSPYYKLQVDFLPHHDNDGAVENPDDEYQAIRGFDRFFHIGGDSWGRKINRYIQDKALWGLGLEVFKVSSMNYMTRLSHRRKKEKYSEEKEDHRIEQINKKLTEMRQKRQKKMDNRLRMKRTSERRAAEKKQQAKLEARRKGERRGKTKANRKS